MERRVFARRVRSADQTVARWRPSAVITRVVSERATERSFAVLHHGNGARTVESAVLTAGHVVQGSVASRMDRAVATPTALGTRALHRSVSRTTPAAS